MNKTELDRKYYPQYLELLNLVQEGLKIEEVAKQGFDDMYQLGQLSALSQPRSQASKYFNSGNGNY